MSTNFELGRVRHIPLSDLVPSTTESQSERRAHFDKAALKELGESMRSVGQLSAIIARQASQIDVVESDGGGRWYPAYKRKEIEGHNFIGGGHKDREAAEAQAAKLRDEQKFEIVAGERRFMAAKAVGMQAIAVDVRELNDEQVIEIQLVENLQREGLHELAEAEGYDKLQKQYGHSAEEIADKVGKSKAYVYARMKLLALDPASRQAFYGGTINASIALLLARIPVASLQRQAVGEITNGKQRYDGQPMSFREARDHVERNYMLRLADAPFSTKDETLLPKAGACGPCIKRTGNQSDLFADIKSADVCTDTVCFKLKREAWGKLQIATAKESGQRVIAGAQAKAVVDSYGHITYGSGLAKLDDYCHDDPKRRTFKQLLGKGAATILVHVPKTGDVIEVVDKGAAVKQLKKDGVIKAREHESTSNVSSAAKRQTPAEKAEETALHNALLAAIHAKSPKKLTLAVLQWIGDHEIDAVGDIFDMLAAAWGWKASTHAEIKKLNEGELQQLLCEMHLLEQIEFSSDRTGELIKAAKSLGVDVKKVRASIPSSPKKAVVKPKAKAKKSRGKK